MAKINQLTKMKISEISLVTDPASPGADIIFTKAETRVRKFDPDEPRDERGRWTSRAVAAMGHVKGAARQIAQALSERAKAAAKASVGTTVSAISTTKPRGAFAVHGGGVQFDFEHKTAAGHMIDTSVQIRPEHLGENRHLKRGLAGLHQILLSGGSDIKRPFTDSSYDYAGQGNRNEPKLFSNWWRANVHRPSLFGQGNSSSGGSSAYAGGGSGSSVPFSMRGPAAGAPLPLSTENGGMSGKRQMAPGGIPEYLPSEHASGHIREIWRQQPEGKNQKTADDFPIPLAGAHTHQTAGGWPYYYHDTFIPGARPDVQAHMEHVHDELARNEALRATRERQMQQDVNPSNSNGRAYFNKRGNYIPYGTQGDQLRHEQRYYSELMRRQDIGEHVYEQHKPSPAQTLFHDEHGNRVTEETTRKSEGLHVPSKDAVAEFMRTKGVTHVPPGHAAGGFSQHERIGTKPTVAKMLFK